MTIRRSQMILDLLRSATKVGLERLRPPGDRPAWTFGKHFMADLLRRDMQRAMSMTIDEQRAFFEARARLAPSSRSAKVKRENTTVAGMEAAWFIPANEIPGATLVYWHGGGYCICSIDTHAELISRLAHASGCRTLAVNYRLAPEHPHPAAIDDALSVMRFLREQGHDPSRTAVAGDSAGGNPSLVVSLALRDQGEPVPGACMCISPWLDLAG